MNFFCIDKYIERKVFYATIGSFEEFSSTINLGCAVVALYSHRVYKDNDKIKFLEKVISCNPLAIFLAGEDSEKLFNLLLEILSRYSGIDHIMTYIAKDDNWIFPFFYSTWPSEERYDFWKEYLIIEIGTDKSLNEIKEFILDGK